MPHPDQVYITALKENDHHLIEKIYMDHSEMIIRLVRSNNGTEADAQDIMQDALISLYQYSLKGFELSCSFKSFLFTMCRNRWFNVLNSKAYKMTSRIASIEEHQLLREASSDFEYIEFQEARFAFCMKIFNQLGPKCKALLSASWKEDENGKNPTWKQLSEVFGLTYGYTRKKASKCYRRLIELARKDPDYLKFNFKNNE